MLSLHETLIPFVSRNKDQILVVERMFYKIFVAEDGVFHDMITELNSYEVIVSLIENDLLDINYVTLDGIDHRKGYGPSKEGCSNVLMLLFLHSYKYTEKTIRICKFLLGKGINIYHNKQDGETYDDLILERMSGVLGQKRSPDELTRKSVKSEAIICLQLWEMIAYRRGDSLAEFKESVLSACFNQPAYDIRWCGSNYEYVRYLLDDFN